MTSILSSLPIEVISQIISEFNKPTLNIPDEITNKTEFQQATQEISKLYEIVRNNPPETATLLLKEHNLPESIIGLLQKEATKSNDSNYSYAWRLDQSVPNVQAILLNITNKSTGHVKTIRMDLCTFHKLRYNVSLLIKEHAVLEKRINK